MPPPNLEPDQYSREIAQRLTYLNRYVALSMAFLITAAVLIVQRIADDRRETENHQAVKDRAGRAVEEAAARLVSLREALGKSIERADQRKKTIVHLSADDSHIVATAADALRPESGPDVENALIATATARLRALAAKDDGYRDAEIILQRSVAQAHQYIQLREIRDAKLQALQQVSREKSFPIPVFGSINLDPEVALAYLSLIAACSHLFLIVATRRALRLAPQAAGIATIVPPVWLYTESDSCRQILGWRSGEHSARLASAVVVHLSWLGLSLALAYATFAINAHEKIAFIPAPLFKGLVVAANALALLAAFSELFPVEAEELTPAGEARRALLALVIASMSALPLVLLAWRRNSRVASPHARLVPPTLLKNAKTGTVHHGRICAPHLRNAKHLDTPPNEPTTFHGSHEIAIVLATVADIESKVTGPQDERLQAAASLLKNALQRHPMSWNLLDKLIRVYGRMKQYENIALSIDAALTKAKEAAGKNRLRDKTVERAVATLESRKARNQNRAAQSRAKGQS